MSDSEEELKLSSAYQATEASEEVDSSAADSASADYARNGKKAETGTSVIVEQPRLQTQTSLVDEGDDIDVECSSVANAADALKAQQEVIRHAEQNEGAQTVSHQYRLFLSN